MKKRYPDGGKATVRDQPVLDFAQSYIQSPVYQQRLSNFYQYPSYVQRQRSNVLSNITFRENPGTSSRYYPSENELSISELQLRSTPGATREEIVAHELSHATNVGPNRASRISTPEANFILDRNKSVDPNIRKSVEQRAKETGVSPIDLYSEELHDYNPAETKSDIDALRFLMNDKKIYDARKGDIGQDQLDKAKKNKDIKQSPVFKRLQKNFDDKDLIDIMNKIAYNPKQDSKLAQNGEKIGRDKDIKGPISYLNSYYNSSEFRRKAGERTDELLDMIGENSKKYKAFVMEDDPMRIGSASIPDPQLAKLAGFPPGHNIVLSKPQAREFGMDYIQDVLPHEYTHTTRGTLTDDESTKFTYVNKNKKAEKLMREYKSVGDNQQFDGFSDWASQLDINDHDLLPSENYADLNSLRYMLYRQGIYDARKEKMTIDHIKKAQKDPWLKKQFTFKRLLETFKPEDIVNLNNEVAYQEAIPDNNNNNTMANNGKKLMYANGGGLSRSEDYGSKKKPYPSVKSSDFAGGGRSYPIPTKADAIDALRLAGLHGREDVKAKVYKKYPELKKANMGTKMKNLTGYNYTPQLTYLMGDQMEYGGYVERFSEGSAFCDPAPRYTRNYSQGQLGGSYGIPPKVYEHGGNINSFTEGSMFMDDTPYYVPMYDGMGIPPKVYANGGIIPTADSFAANPFPPNFNRYPSYEPAYQSEYPEAKYGYTAPYDSGYRNLVDANFGGNWAWDQPNGRYMSANPYHSTPYTAASGIKIKPENRGKFNATKKRTGKTTEELTHFKNPITRKRAIFAQNAAKSNKGQNGMQVGPYGDILPVYQPINISTGLENVPQQPLQTNTNYPSYEVDRPPYEQQDQRSRQSNRGSGLSANFSLSTAAPIMGLAALVNQTTERQNAARESARNTRRLAQTNIYNPYRQGTGATSLYENGGSVDPVTQALSVLRDYGYDIEMD